MKILAIETSTEAGSIAVLEDGHLLLEDFFAGGRGNDSRIFLSLEKILPQAGELDHILVGVGPGGYSGLRVGISAALALKIGRSLPASGFYSILGYPEPDYHVVLDARGSWIYARIKGEQIEIPPHLISEEELAIIGETTLPIYGPHRFPNLPVRLETPRAAILASRFSRGLSGLALPLQPIYLKAPHITAAKPVSGLAN